MSKNAVESRRHAWSNRRSELGVYVPVPLGSLRSVSLAKFLSFARLGLRKEEWSIDGVLYIPSEIVEVTVLDTVAMRVALSEQGKEIPL